MTAVVPARGGLAADIRRSWIVVALVAAVGAGAGVLLSQTQPVAYTAEARVFLLGAADAGVFRVERTERELRLEREVRLLESNEVAEAASPLLDGLDSAVIRRRTRASAALALDMIQVRAKAPTAQAAADTSNAVVEAYRTIRRETGLARVQRASGELTEFTATLRLQLTASEARLDEIRLSHESDLPIGTDAERLVVLSQLLETDPRYAEARATRDAVLTQLLTVESRVREIAADAAVEGDGVEFVEPAEPPSAPSQPNTERNILLGLLLGLVAGAGVARLRAERLAPTSARQIAEQSGMRFLGVLPSVQRPSNGVDADAIDAVEVVHAAVAHAVADDSPSCVLVCAPTAGCGVSTLAANLALVASRKGAAVALIDADMGGRSLTRLFSNDDALGLLQLLGGTHRVDEVEQLILDSRNVTSFIPAGRRPERRTVSLGAAWRAVPGLTASSAALTVIDCPPVLSSSVALEIAESADAIVVVAGPTTTVDELSDLQTRLGFVGATLLGVVVNQGPRLRRLARDRSGDGLVAAVLVRAASLARGGLPRP